MLGWLGEKEASSALMECVENVCRQGVLTLELGGKANTKEFTEAVCAAIQNWEKAQVVDDRFRSARCCFSYRWHIC
jgi:hypothetical protein